MLMLLFAFLFIALVKKHSGKYRKSLTQAKYDEKHKQQNCKYTNESWNALFGTYCAFQNIADVSEDTACFSCFIFFISLHNGVRGI